MPPPPTLVPAAVSLIHAVCVHTALSKVAVTYTYRFFTSRTRSSNRATTNHGLRDPMIKHSYHQHASTDPTYNLLGDQPRLGLETPIHESTNINTNKLRSIPDTMRTSPSSAVPTSQIIEALKASTANPTLQDAIRELISFNKSKEEFLAQLSSFFDPKFVDQIKRNLRDDISTTTYEAMTEKLSEEKDSYDKFFVVTFLIVLGGGLAGAFYILDRHLTHEDELRMKDAEYRLLKNKKDGDIHDLNMDILRVNAKKDAEIRDLKREVDRLKGKMVELK